MLVQVNINGSAQSATATAFRRALEDRLKAEAKSRGRSLDSCAVGAEYGQFPIGNPSS